MEDKLRERGLEVAVGVVRRELHAMRLTIAKREAQLRARRGADLPSRLGVLREQLELLELAEAALKETLVAGRLQKEDR